MIHTYKRFLTLLLLLLMTTFILRAQQGDNSQQLPTERATLIWGVNNYNFFDNREVRTPYQRSQTLFGARLGAEVGVQLGPNALIAGGQVIKDFGTNGIASGDFTFYYHYEKVTSPVPSARFLASAYVVNCPMSSCATPFVTIPRCSMEHSYNIQVSMAMPSFIAIGSTSKVWVSVRSLSLSPMDASVIRVITWVGTYNSLTSLCLVLPQV